MYHENRGSRSPGAQRHQPQTLHRQSSRHFDAYGAVSNGPMTTGSYYTEDPMRSFDPSRMDRVNQTITSTNFGGYDLPTNSQTWGANVYSGAHTLGSMGASGRMKLSPRGRAGIPSPWLDQQSQLNQPPVPSIPSAFGGLSPGMQAAQQMRQESAPSDTDDELIPTAIVIKNIPFAVKKEQLQSVMTELNLPLPYAFNYHFDNGVFRGLAFANFTSAEETAAVIDRLNHYELQGRKLRVEYKKMLPLQERERIEREKRERRGQLEEQHRPMAGPTLHAQASMTSLSSRMQAASPTPMAQRTTKLGRSSPLPGFQQQPLTAHQEVDMNDPEVLSLYSKLLLFKEDQNQETSIFPANLTPTQRRTVHTLAHNMGLGHESQGAGNQRQVRVFRASTSGYNISPPMSSISAAQSADSSRRALNRAATTDFSEARAAAAETGFFNTFRGGSGFLGPLDTSAGLGNSQILRAAKSHTDLRSYTPSPVPSTASFPAALQNTGNRLQHYDGFNSNTSNTPTLTPAASGSALGPQYHNADLLVNGIGNMNIGTSLSANGSPSRLRSVYSWEHDLPSQHQQNSAGAIGSNRSIGLGFDTQSQDRNPIRQPRGPGSERQPGFRRNGHQGRGSEELRSSNGVPIIVE